MAKKQLNLYVDDKLQELLREESERLHYKGPSEFVTRQLLGYFHGDLGAIQNALEYALTRSNRPINNAKLLMLKRVIDSFVVGG